MLKNKPTVLILGKLPPPFMGPAIATEILLNSELKVKYNLIHLDTAINAEINQMGKFSMNKVLSIFKLYRSFRKVLKKHNPDLVLIPISQTTSGFFKDAYFINNASSNGSKVLIHLRGSNFKNWIDNSSSTVAQRVTSVLKRTNGVVVLGDKLKYLFSDYFQDDKIFVVPNGADYTFPKPVKNGLILRYISNYLPGKGIEDVLNAIAILKKEGITNFTFQAHGSWDNLNYKVKCQQIINSNKLENVILNSSISGDEKWNALANSSIFIFTPRSPEGHPWNLVEATAAGLPIISTDRGAITETVFDLQNGFIVPSAAPGEIAEKLKLLLIDNDLRTKMGNKSREIYLNNFTEKHMVDNLDLAIQKTLRN